MKIFFCLIIATVAIGAQALTEEQEANRRKWRAECESEPGIDREELNKERRGEQADQSQVDKYLFCIYKKAGLITESGDLIVDQIKIKLRRVVDNDDEVDKVVAKCAVKKETPEKTASTFSKCMQASKPDFSPA